ncbi:MAG: threonylcarbamoyl-AMP synthase [Flaviaesturariibacter sp.]|nr:threonylcarbamoyl-AMP synthase [Flaviaesturariibacter sp.]
MENAFFDGEVEAALASLRSGGVILYPTDTIWGLGCDATDEKAIRRIYDLKQRADTKSLIILVSHEREVLPYVAAPDPAAFGFLEEQDRPTTMIFDDAVGLPPALVGADGTIAIRIVKDPFCRHLVRRLRKPIVSTSANISGRPSPPSFASIDPEIIAGVDHVVRWRQDETGPAQASRIVRWHRDGTHAVIRP